MSANRACCEDESRLAFMATGTDVGGGADGSGLESNDFHVFSSDSRRSISLSSSFSFSAFLTLRGFGFLGKDDAASSV
jgi:hypothetical protein